jgi:hypothetical protein
VSHYGYVRTALENSCQMIGQMKSCERGDYRRRQAVREGQLRRTNIVSLGIH